MAPQTAPERRLLAAMLATIAAVIGLAIVDQERESRVAVEELTRSQTLLASAVASNIQAELERHEVIDAASAARILALAHVIETPGESLSLLGPTETDDFYTASGAVIHSTAMAHAIRHSVASMPLLRDVSKTLGLPERRAIAVFTTFPRSPWAFAFVNTARREREREDRSRLRFVLAVSIVILIVGGYGTAALRRARRQLALGREVEVLELARQRDEQLTRASRMATVAALAGGVAHEIATPLGVIASRTEQLARAVTGDERSSAAAAAILNEVHRIERAMRGFLAFARGEQPSRVPLTSGDLVAAAVNLVRHRFEAAHVRLDVHVAPDTADVSGDATLLEHALVNLLLNACDAAPRESVVVMTVKGAANTVVFDIVDKGAGIAHDIAERVQEPFFTTKPSGSGLGLAIVSEIAAHHGGTFAIASNGAELGTRATMTLPAM